MNPARLSLVRVLLLVTVLPLFLGSGCMTAKDGLQNLDALHVEVEEPQLAYAPRIPRRSWWWRLKRNTLAIVGLGPPSLEATVDVDDPIGCALESLEAIRENEDQLDGVDRWVAILLVSEWARRDRSRVVRSASFQTIEVLLEQTDDEDEDEFQFETDVSLESDIVATLEGVRWLVQTPKAQVAQVIESRWDDLRRSAASLLLIKGESVGLSERLGKLAALSAQQTDQYTIHREFEAAARQQALRCAFQSCQSALTESTANIQSAALSTMIAIDPRAAGPVIAGVYDRLYAGTVKIELLRSLQDSGIRAQELDSNLRLRLPRELDALDSGVAYWTRQSMTAMLQLPEGLSDEELRARWEAVNDPAPAPERP